MIFGDKICTPRLLLRRLATEDIPLFVAWSNSETAHGGYLTPDRMTLKEGESIVRGDVYWQEQNRIFFIEKKDNGGIGTVRYWLRPERKDCAVMAVKIAEPTERNKGYGTEAQKYLIIHVFSRMKAQSIEMYTDINNKAQQRCLSKLGFSLLDTLHYDDHQVHRVGHLYQLTFQQYSQNAVYKYHYE
jgi:RimJ/RimL family protein N-acetyltransferase